MGTITATPSNPVPVVALSVVQTATTQIAWDTRVTGLLGRLRMSVNNGPFKRFGGAAEGAPATRGGNAPLVVHLGDQYAFELRQDGTETLLAQYVVTTKEQDVLRIADAIHVHIPVKQAIYQFQIDPGVELVRVRFRTRQPCAPFVDVKNPETGALAGARLGFSGLIHDFDLPLGQDPTAQDTVFSLHVFAPSTEGVVQPAEKQALFRTGRRRAQILFEHLFVTNDGDPGVLLGDGDFLLAYGAGELGVSEPFGLLSYVGSVGSGEDRSLHGSINIDPAPEAIWVQVNAFEADEFGFILGGARVSFRPEGVVHSSGDGPVEGEDIIVTKWFDLTALGGETFFSLESGPLVFDFNLTGLVRVEVEEGALLEPQVRKTFRPVYVPDPVAYLDRGDRTRVGEHTWLQRSPDGELYQAHHGEELLHPRWSRVVGLTPAPVTVVLAENGPQLFSVDDEGHGLALDEGRDAWRPIGGQFVGGLLAAHGPKGATLVGLDRKGVVHQSCGDGEWSRVGEGVAGDLSAFASGEGVALVARGQADQVLYRGAGDEAWRCFDRSPQGRLWGAATPSGAAFAVLREDETLAVTIYDGEDGPLEWREAGDIDGLLDRRCSLADFPNYPQGPG